jgi:hypothetical protein
MKLSPRFLRLSLSILPLFLLVSSVKAQKELHFGGDVMLGSTYHLPSPKNSFFSFQQQPRFYAGLNNNLGWLYYDVLYEWDAANRTYPVVRGITHHYEINSHNLLFNMGLGPQQKYWHFTALGGLGGNLFGGTLLSYNKFPDGTISYALDGSDNGVYINNVVFYLQYGAELGAHFGRKTSSGAPRWRVNIRALNRSCMDNDCGNYYDRGAAEVNFAMRSTGIANLDSEYIGFSPGWTGWNFSLNVAYRLFDISFGEIRNNH